MEPHNCARCHLPHTGKNRTCDECLAERRSHHKRLAELREAAGLCSRCPADATPGYRTCARCRDACTTRQKVLRSGAAPARTPGRPRAAHCEVWAKQFRDGWPPVKIAATARVHLGRVYAALILRGLHKPQPRAA